MQQAANLEDNRSYTQYHPPYIQNNQAYPSHMFLHRSRDYKTQYIHPKDHQSL